MSVSLRDLQCEILEGPLAAKCKPHAHTADMTRISGAEVMPKDQAVTDILNGGAYPVYRETFVNAVGLMSRLGVQVGALLLDRLEAAATNQVPVLKWAVYALKSERGINVADQQTQDMLDNLATLKIISEAQAESVKAIGRHTVGYAESVYGRPVTVAEVSRALRGPRE